MNIYITRDSQRNQYNTVKHKLYFIDNFLTQR